MPHECLYLTIGRESDSEAEDFAHAENLLQVKVVLEEKGHFSGIYRKVQLKPLSGLKSQQVMMKGRKNDLLKL